MFIKSLPAVRRLMPRFSIRQMSGMGLSSEPSTQLPKESGQSIDSTRWEASEAEMVVDKVMEESVRRMTGGHEFNWDSSMAVIKKTEEHLPLRKPTEKELLKIRKVLNSTSFYLKF
jgi:hypothetical protein